MALGPNDEVTLEKCRDKDKKVVCFIGPPLPADEVYSNTVIVEEEEDELPVAHDGLVGHETALFDPWALPELTVHTGPKWKGTVKAINL